MAAAMLLISRSAGVLANHREALGLETKHVSPDCRILTIEQSAWGTDIQSPKTFNAIRKVDLAPELAEVVRKHLRTLNGGLVFPNANGKPLSQTNVLRRNLHPLLKQVGVPKQGFHGTRRFRATWLRKQMAPEDLIHFWLGHSPTNITDVLFQAFRGCFVASRGQHKSRTGFFCKSLNLKWRAQGDSNSRPLASEASALSS